MPTHRPDPPPDGLPELLAESDFVVLAAPLTPGTEDLFDAGPLAAKPGAWLINVARGGLVDERALNARYGRAARRRRARHVPRRAAAADSPLYGLHNLS